MDSLHLAAHRDFLFGVIGRRNGSKFSGHCVRFCSSPRGFSSLLRGRPFPLPTCGSISVLLVRLLASGHLLATLKLERKTSGELDVASLFQWFSNGLPAH